MNAAAFEVGKTYTCRSIVNSDHIHSARIIKRTAHTVTVYLEGCTTRGPKTFRVSRDYCGAECFRPEGSYSMAPTISAG